jgi:hypothetical protein
MANTPGTNTDEQIAILDRTVYDLKYRADYDAHFTAREYLAILTDIETAAAMLRAHFEGQLQ